jgi:hypothetical protein
MGMELGLSLKEEQRLGSFENKVVTTTLGRKRERGQATG